MSTDVKLDEHGGGYLVLEAEVVKTTASDLIIDAPSRHRPGTHALRRAMVHDQRDGLTINFNRDYPGGVTILDVVEITNRLGGLKLKEVAEITATKLAGAETARSDFSGRLVMRGEVIIEAPLAARSVAAPATPASTHAESFTEGVSLQALLGDLLEKVNALTRKVAELERVSRSPVEAD